MKQKKLKDSDNAECSSRRSTADVVVPVGHGKPKLQKEIGGTSGPEPTRYGDWEHKGRCYDF